MSETISGTIVELWEGRGQGDGDYAYSPPSFTVGWYFTELEAIAGVKGKGGWGSDGKVVRHQVLKQNHNDGSSSYYKMQVIEVSSINLDKMREEALAKLTPAEKKLLGVE